MIDNLMREIGIEGGSLGRMTEVLRDAKDIAALTRDGKKGAKEKPVKPGEDDRDREAATQGLSRGGRSARSNVALDCQSVETSARRFQLARKQ